jgi:hypothetical protein
MPGARPLLLTLLSAAALAAAVRHVEVIERSPAGPYERLVLRAHFQVDARVPANRLITDLRYAPVNRAGLVEFSADAYILRPRDAAKSNGTVLFEVSNRGGRSLLNTFSYGKGKDDPGDGLLFDQGYTLAWVAWQFDVPEGKELLTLSVPRAQGVQGLVRSEAVITDKAGMIPVADRGHIPYPAVDPKDPHAKLYIRDLADSPRMEIPREQWRFPDLVTVELDGGFQPHKRYEIVYTSQDPAVAGLGFAAIRDFISFLKFDNGLASGVKRSIAWGSSQSGRFLREFLYQGFNADEQGRRVFDGLMPHIAGAGRGSFHHRFAQPSRLGPWYTTDIFPFRDLDDTDPVTHVTDGLLRVATATNTVPKIFYTNTSNEYWRISASLIHTSIDGSADAPLAPSTRIYYLTGAQHGPGSWPPGKQSGMLNLTNANDYRPILRALLTAMNEWITTGKEPPPSRYPANTPDQLAAPESLRFPKIDGFLAPNRLWHAQRLDFGPDFRAAGVIAFEPPKVIGEPYPIKVPQIDADGNEVAGVRNPVQSVALATYAGWNINTAAPGNTHEIAGLAGSYIPFPATRADRERMHDSRLSIEERYPSRSAYLDKVTAAAKKLVADRYLLEADVPRILERAAAEWSHPRDSSGNH